MMTIADAFLGALTLAFGPGKGVRAAPASWYRHRGLNVTQMLDALHRPVVYLYLDRRQSWLLSYSPRRHRKREKERVHAFPSANVSTRSRSMVGSLFLL